MGAPAAIAFDVFGTVVDWRSPAAAALADVAGRPGDWGAVADRWRREGYLAPIAAMASGAAPVEPIDAVLRRHATRLLAEAGVAADDGDLDRLVGVWDRLEAWPDVHEGLARLRGVAPVATCSNATFAGLVRMARHAGLGWDAVISSELFGSYKPDPVVYLGTARLLGVAPGDLLLVAAHPADLAAARACGLRTAYVPRPLEWGPAGAGPPDDGAEVTAADLVELAARLGG